MKKLLILICLTACATESNNNPTTNLCQAEDTACQCEANPSLPQCGDVPITPEQAAVLAVQQDTADYVAGLGGSLDPATVVVEKFEQWHTTAIYNAGFGNFRVTCTYNMMDSSGDPVNPRRTGCTVMAVPHALKTN